jgi:RNA polymerase sigma-70 factor (sigma-E family)
MRGTQAVGTRHDADEPLPEGETEPADRLEELYARHVPETIGFAYLLTGDRPEAEDLVHEAFVKVVGRLRHLRQPEAFDAYLMRTVVNLHTSQLRHLRVERAYLSRERRRRAPQAMPPDFAERDEVWKALEALPPRQRAAVVLRYYEDLTERDTAEVLRCSVPAVKSLMARAMETLRTQIRGDA